MHPTGVLNVYMHPTGVLNVHMHLTEVLNVYMHLTEASKYIQVLRISYITDGNLFNAIIIQ